ncbi:MAG: NlpC/P60 family protein [Thermoleophilaceae bacterium]
MARDSGASELLARMLADPAFRAAFKAEPERALREAGLTELARRVGPAGPGKALETLEIRESRSSLAGAMMAAALEGVGLVGADQAMTHAAAPPAPVADGAPAAQAPAGALGPDDIVEIAQERKVAAQPAAESDAGVESDGPDGGDADHGDGSGEEPAGDENENDENESDEYESDGGDEGSDDDQDDPGEGSNGEDANDSASDGDSGSGDGDSDSGDGPGSSEDDQDSPGDASSDDSDNDSGSDDDSADGGSAAGEALGQIAPSDYPGDGASQAELARWMAAEAQKRGLPPELPVMAALTESGMQNLDHGDRDSVGFFQMRLGTWNRNEYAGYPDDPKKQLDWFLDHAAAVKAQRVSRGQSVADPNQYGGWIADIERPAAEYRGRYQLNYRKAHVLLESVAAQKQSAAGAAADLIDVTVGGKHAGSRALEAVTQARRQMGVPYKWGGSSPGTGFDCSGLVQWVYAKVGISIPRVTDQQILASNGTGVDRNHLLPGDLVFFRDSGGYVHHVGISLGGDKFINAPHTGAKVRIDSLEDPYWGREFTGGRRFDHAVGVEVEARAAVAAAPPADDRAAQIAQAALERDAAEVGRPGTALFQALERQERGKNDQVQFLPAVSRTP